MHFANQYYADTMYAISIEQIHVKSAIVHSADSNTLIVVDT